MNPSKTISTFAAASLLAFGATNTNAQEHRTARDNVIWTAPSKDAAGSMPLGNGELGINLWVEENGDLLFYLSRNDSYTEVSQLCKVGKVRVSLSPNPFTTGTPFRQELKLVDGVCEINAGKPKEKVRLKVFVDSAHPVVHVIGQSLVPTTITAKVHVEEKILLLPAWPKDWDVSFKLHAPRRTTGSLTHHSKSITCMGWWK